MGGQHRRSALADRLPFYARRNAEQQMEVFADRPEVMRSEIQYARQGEIDFWAFCYYDESSGV